MQQWNCCAAKDSSLVKVAMSDKNGVAEFENIPYGNYIIKAGVVNHSNSYSSSVTLSAEQSLVQTGTITIKQVSKELEGVTVAAKKPFVQRLTDRIVVNVENSIVNAGATAMDVLERSPGVRVGQNDAISMAGKGGVIIMINGKQVPMSEKNSAIICEVYPVV